MWGDVGAYSDTLQVTLQELTILGFTTINVTVCKSLLTMEKPCYNAPMFNKPTRGLQCQTMQNSS